MTRLPDVFGQAVFVCDRMSLFISVEHSGGQDYDARNGKRVLIDRYRVVRLLGQGGFGAVYRVWDLHLNGPFALKKTWILRRKPFASSLAEAQILANLHHPNLPRVTDHFSLPDQGQYLVMEYVEGEDLEEKRCNPLANLPDRCPKSKS